LLQYYAEAPVIPAEVLIPLEIEERGALAELLSDQRGARVTVLCPQRGEKRALVDLAQRNARANFEEKRLADKAQRDALDQVRGAFHLPRPPERIECFDISTSQGDTTVGSMVAFDGGVPNKQRYRRFSIRSVAGQDDFAAMREVLMRRYQRAVEERDLPDLVLIDGGKGQLGVAHAVLKDLGIEDVPLVAIAKARSLEGGDHSPERFFVPGRANPIIPPQSGPVVRLLARVRDEAHRFAVNYHRGRRRKATLATALTGIPGVGPKRARTLLTRLGSVARIREASIDAIAALPGFSVELARAVHEHLNLDRTSRP
ncbi:MAG TPA: helix-hairpin-helix domain-containing protein, partial [Candidatus Hydrogenedentes bacterium]|nr:helix-hairpin-helix domain-containing protein [Candidatus Hydrogenedentota bacterium]